MTELCSKEQLTEDVYVYAKRIARGFAARCPSIDADEIESGAMLGAVHAIRTYDPERGPLLPYARRRITHYILEALRAETGFREKRHRPATTQAGQDAHARARALRHAVDVTDLHATYGDPALVKHDTVEDEVVALDVLRGIVEATRKIAPEDLSLLVRVNNGTSGRAIAREIGISGTAVNKRVMKARERIREHLLEHGYLEQDAA